MDASFEGVESKVTPFTLQIVGFNEIAERVCVFPIELALKEKVDGFKVAVKVCGPAPTSDVVPDAVINILARENVKDLLTSVAGNQLESPACLAVTEQGIELTIFVGAIETIY